MPDAKTSRTPGQGRPRDPNLDDALIRAALELLAKTGPDGVTIAEVRRLTGIPATSIYRRYPDAHSLVVAAIEADLSELQTLFEDQGSLRDELLAFLRTIANTFSETRARILAGLLLPMLSDPKTAAPLISRLAELRDQSWRGIIGRAIARGTLRPEALDAPPLDEVAQALILHQRIINIRPVDEVFLAGVLDNVLMPALAPFAIP